MAMGSELGKLDAACLIMAGGEGRRFTPDKPLLKIDGQSIIWRVVEVVRRVFSEILLVTNTPGKYDFLGLPHIGDEIPGCGPLMGIYSGLRAIKAERAFVCAADMPFMDERIIRAEFGALADYDMVVPYPNGLPEFLHGIYQVRSVPTIKDNLDQGRYKIDLLRECLDVLILGDDWFSRHGFQHLKEKAFANINLSEDYDKWTKKSGAAGVKSDSYGREEAS